MQSIRNLMESASALSRFKVHNGITATTQNRGSSYILMAKLKRALTSGIDKGMFATLKLRYFTPLSEVKREVFIDRLLSKIDGFQFDQLNYCINIYETDGIVALSDLLRIPSAKIAKMAAPAPVSKRDEEESCTIEDIDFSPEI